MVWAAADQISDTSDVTLVQTGSKLDLAGFTDTIASLNLPTGTSVETGTAGVLTVIEPPIVNGEDQSLPAPTPPPSLRS